jgi:hypothetical protein
VTLAALAGALVLVVPGSSSSAVPPERVLSQPPYMGVSCGVPNWIGCERVGLTVWLRRPALGVRALIAGHHVALDDREWSGPLRSGRRRWFAGFLQRRGLFGALGVKADAGPGRWMGRGAPSPAVRLWIDYGRGHLVVTSLPVFLHPGWG